MGGINELLEELGTHAEEMVDICARLSNCIEEYRDNAGDAISEADI
jgi:hypothetical protein